MRKSLVYAGVLVILTLGFAVAPAGADTLKLKSGQSVDGKYLGGTDSRIDFLVEGRVQTYNVSDVQSLSFEGKSYGQSAGSSSGTTSSSSQPYTADPMASSSAAPSPSSVSTSSSSSASSVTIPAGTTIVVRMIDGVDSNVNKVGDTFNASLEAPLVVGSTVLAQKGADVYGRLVEAKQAGHIQGQSELRLELTGVKINNQVVSIVTGAYEAAGQSRGKNTAEKVGGGAVIGALIGAIAGGGKGAAIGAGVGAGAGTAVQVMTHGQQVRVPSETVLNFTLQQPVTVPAAS